MTDTDDTDDARTVPENADTTQPPERLADALDDGGTCFHCGESFSTREALADHAADCDGGD